LKLLDALKEIEDGRAFTCSDAERRLKQDRHNIDPVRRRAFTCSDAERRLKPRALAQTSSCTGDLSHAVMPKGV